MSESPPPEVDLDAIERDLDDVERALRRLDDDGEDTPTDQLDEQLDDQVRPRAPGPS